MQESTRREYKRLAEHFYATRLGDLPRSPKRLEDTLRAAAADYRPAYWRRLRKALEIDQQDRGYIANAVRISQATNPMTTDGGGTGDVKPKQRRCRKVSDDDILTIGADADRRGDRVMKCVLYWTRITGLRPSEIPSVRVLDNGRIRIEGAKQSHGGQRGAGRDLVVDPEIHAQLKETAKDLPKDAAEVGRIQRRLQATVNRLFPTRKAKPSLYSIRHQIGSDLKASGLPRAEIATIMGHQATASVDQYGSRRSGRKGGYIPRAAEINAEVRQTHDQPYSQHPGPEPQPRREVPNYIGAYDETPPSPKPRVPDDDDDDPMREPPRPPKSGDDLGM